MSDKLKLILGAIIRVIAGTALLATVVIGIDHYGYQRAESKYLLQIAKQKSDAETALKLAEAARDARYAAQNRSMLWLTEQLIAANNVIDVQKIKLQERARDVSTQYRPQPDAALLTVPGWIVTNGWLCDYNRAIDSIGYGLPQAGTAIDRTEDPACQADPFTVSAITAEQILIHHEEYGAYTQSLEQQINRLLDYENEIQEAQ